ncbi:MAG TPA: hypothetical protein VFM21_04055, partial [Terriglobia bacterium]|nr:hypothetical protein [Terriglobia bacterium]
MRGLQLDYVPPQEFLSQYVKAMYPDLNAPLGAVIGRDAPRHADNYLYRDPDTGNRFTRGLFDLLGVKDFIEFRSRFVLTDAIRCHCSGPHVPDKPLSYCARHLREELKLFPNLRMLVVLGEDAYLQFQRFMLERKESEFPPFEEALSKQGWADEQARLPAFGERTVQIFYCYHPTYGYKRSP